MPVNESRVKNALLKLEGAAGAFVDLACQATAVRIVPDVAAGDQLETVGGCMSSGSGGNTATLEVTAISDFLDPAGLVAWSWKHSGEERQFQWTPNGANPGETWTGSITVVPIPVGGDANVRLTEQITWTVTQLTLPTSLGGTDFIGTKPATPVAGPSKGAAAPGDTFPAEATVTAADATNAAKLAGLGYVAKPATAWTTGQKVTIGTFDFHWDGSAWAENAA
jgi:hypothetical protein